VLSIFSMGMSRSPLKLKDVVGVSGVFPPVNHVRSQIQSVEEARVFLSAVLLRELSVLRCELED